MAKVQRVLKSSGGTSFQSGTIAYAAEVEGDIQALQAAADDIDNTQVSASAAIETSKIDGYSDSDAEAWTVTSPGSTATGALSKAVSLQGEIERLRYALQRIQTGTTAKFLNASNAEQAVAWQEPPIVGPNLVPNASFDLWDATNAVPFGWTAEDGGGSVTLSTSLTEVGLGEGFRVVATGDNASQQGLSVTLEGLKVDTKYLVGAMLSSGTNDAFLVTEGGLAASNAYQDLSLSTDSVSLTLVSGVVQSASSTPDLTIKILTEGVGATDAIEVDHVFCYELGDNPVCVTKPYAAQVTATGGAIITPTTWAAVPGLTVNAVRPGTDCQIRVTASISFSPTTGDNYGFRIKRDSTVIHTSGTSAIGGASLLSVNLDVVDSPPAGAAAAYVYTVETQSASGNINISPTVGGMTGNSLLIVEVR